MSESKNLPAVPMPNTKGQEVNPHYTGGYILAETEREIRIAPVLPDGHKFLDRPEKPRKKEIAKIAGAGIGGYLIAYPSFLYATLESSPLAGGIAAIAYTSSMGYMLGKERARRRLQRGQRQSTTQALESESAVSLPQWQLGVNLPRETLAQEVTFPAESAIATVSAAALLASIGTSAPGIEVRPFQEEDARVEGVVSPAVLVKKSLEWVGKERRNLFLSQVHPFLQDIGDAARKLPPLGLTAETPESLREPFEHAATKLLLGTLSVYGVLRAHAGQRVAEEIRAFYAQQDQEYAKVLQDSLKIDQPTANNIAWQTIENFYRYLPGKESH